MNQKAINRLQERRQVGVALRSSMLRKALNQPRYVVSWYKRAGKNRFCPLAFYLPESR